MPLQSPQATNLTRQKNSIYFITGRLLVLEKKTISEATTLHLHEYYEIELITEGSGEYYHNGAFYPISPGLLFFLTPTDFHQIVPQGPCKILTLEIHENVVSPEWQTHFMSRHANTVFHLEQSDSEQWNARFTIMEAEFDAGDAFTSENQRRMLEIMLSAIARLTREEQEKIKKRSSFQKALDHISRHYCEPLSLETIATAVGYTPQYFCTLFHRQTGRQLMTFITDLRLNRAKMLLRTTDLSITEICYQTGFSSQSSFFRQFRQRLGQTPAEYRKKATS